MPPANVVAAPMERAVATAGAMWVIDWNRTSVSPIAFAFEACPTRGVSGADDGRGTWTPAMPTSWNWPPGGVRPVEHRMHAGKPRGRV